MRLQRARLKESRTHTSTNHIIYRHTHSQFIYRLTVRSSTETQSDQPQTHTDRQIIYRHRQTDHLHTHTNGQIIYRQTNSDHLQSHKFRSSTDTFSQINYRHTVRSSTDTQTDQLQTHRQIIYRHTDRSSTDTQTDHLQTHAVR